MIELIQDYWRAFIYSDGQQITGLAMTLWLTSAALCLGLLLAVPLSIARVSARRWLRFAPQQKDSSRLWPWWQVQSLRRPTHP